MLLMLPVHDLLMLQVLLLDMRSLQTQLWRLLNLHCLQLLHQVMPPLLQQLKPLLHVLLPLLLQLQ